MCLACVGAAGPELALALGGFAAVRFGRPVARLRAARSGATEDSDSADARLDSPDGRSEGHPPH